jgi:acyl-CoA thioesterase
MESMNRFIERDLFAKYLGIEIPEHGPGYAKAKLELTRNHLNSVGTVHGGVVFSLADAAFSAASNSRGAVSVAIQASISFFRAVSGGTLYAVAREAALSPKLATYSIEVRDGSDAPIALFQGTVYRKTAKVEELLAESPAEPRPPRG